MSLLSFARIIAANIYGEFLTLSSCYYIALSHEKVSVEILFNIIQNAVAKSIVSEYDDKGKAGTHPGLGLQALACRSERIFKILTFA